MKPRSQKAPKITETQEHIAIADYFRKVGLGGLAIALHIKNDQATAWQRMNAKKMGVLPGVPDWLILDGGRAGFIELKERGWKARKERTGTYDRHETRQIETQKRLKLAGCWVAICETLEEVQDALFNHGVPLRTESQTTERIRAGVLAALNEASE